MKKEGKEVELRIHLLRHGESEWQAGTSISGDSNLTQKGRHQAKYLADKVSSVLSDSIHYSVISSPLKRSLQTVRYLDREFSVLDDLREASFDVKACLPTFGNPHQHEPDARSIGHYQEFKSLVAVLLDELVSKAAGADIFAFTHGGVIKTLLRSIHGTDAVCYRIDNCSWTTLAWYQGRWHIECLNDVSYVPQTLRSNP